MRPKGWLARLILGCDPIKPIHNITMSKEEETNQIELHGFSVTKRLPPTVKDKVKEGVQAAAKLWQVELPEDLFYGYDYKVAQFGNRPMVAST